MSRWNVLLLVILSGVVLVALAVACGGAQEEPVVPPSVEEPPAHLGGEELLQARCARCHGLDVVKAASKDLGEWEDTVERMRGKGAELTDTEAQTLSEYLAETYGP